MEPLTDEQLKSIGFSVDYKRKRNEAGELVFNTCCLHEDYGTYEQYETVGTYYTRPTFLDIVERISKHSKDKAIDEYKQSISERILDLL